MNIHDSDGFWWCVLVSGPTESDGFNGPTEADSFNGPTEFDMAYICFMGPKQPNDQHRLRVCIVLWD